MAPDDYAYAVLADGARPYRYRAGVRALLGAAEDTGVAVSFTRAVPGRSLHYLRGDQGDRGDPQAPSDWADVLAQPGIADGVPDRPTDPADTWPADAWPADGPAFTMSPTGRPSRAPEDTSTGAGTRAAADGAGPYRYPAGVRALLGVPEETGTGRGVTPTAQGRSFRYGHEHGVGEAEREGVSGGTTEAPSRVPDSAPAPAPAPDNANTATRPLTPTGPTAPTAPVTATTAVAEPPVVTELVIPGGPSRPAAPGTRPRGMTAGTRHRAPVPAPQEDTPVAVSLPEAVPPPAQENAVAHPAPPSGLHHEAPAPAPAAPGRTAKASASAPTPRSATEMFVSAGDLSPHVPENESRNEPARTARSEPTRGPRDEPSTVPRPGPAVRGPSRAPRVRR
ncbi:hypothetical protein ACIBGW_41820, partial [Streptomyces sp. NPDC051016]